MLIGQKNRPFYIFQFMIKISNKEKMLFLNMFAQADLLEKRKMRECELIQSINII